MFIHQLIDLFSRSPRLRKAFNLLLGIALLLGILALIERSDRKIMERQLHREFIGVLVIPSAPFTQDERRIAGQFLADTLPRLMKKGLITRYVRSTEGTTILVPGRVWKPRTRFVKESLLAAVCAFNKVNGFNAWARVVDDRTGRLYAQVLPSERKELYE